MSRFASRPRRLKWAGKLSRYYYVRLVNDDGKRSWRSTGCETLEAAREWKATQELREAKGERYVEDLGFKEACARWIATKEARVSPGYYAVLCVYRREWLRQLSGKKLRALEPDDIERYFRARKAAKLSPRSCNNERAALRTFLLHAQRSGWISRNPLDTVEKFREETRAVRVLEPAQEARLLEEARASGEQTYGFVLCLLSSGLRRGTVAELEWRDVDFDLGEWRIPASKMKSGEDFNGRPIAPALLEHLRAHRGPAGFVFGRLNGKKFNAAAKRAGLEWLRPHDLRRGFVSRCRRLGIPMEVTMFFSDHRDVATVLKSYRAVDPSEAKTAMARVFGAKTAEGGA